MKKAVIFLLLIAFVVGGIMFKDEIVDCLNNPPTTKSTDSAVTYESVETDLVFILGCHSNRPMLTESMLDSSMDAIKVTCKHGGKISIIANSGAPEVVAEMRVPAVDSNLTSSQIKRLISERALEIKKVIWQAKASHPEADLLSCFHMASNLLQASEAPQRLLIVVDSAVASTSATSQLNLCNLGMAVVQNPSAVLDILDKRDVFSASYLKFNSVDIIWDSFTQVADPQKDLSAEAVTAYTEFWTGFLSERAGAKSLKIYNGASADKAYNILPVSPVPIPVVDDNIINLSAVNILDHNKLAFEADSTEFLYPEIALKEAGTWAKAINAKKTPVVIAGMVATVTKSPDAGHAFSLARAESFKSLLCQSGVSGDLITTVGLGYGSSFHVDDLNEDGTLDEECAKLNRIIIVAPLYSEEGRQLIDESK